MKQITFITVGELKENSIIQDNVDEKILNQSILEFQELELEPLLGKNLYRRLSNVLVSGATISDFVIDDDDVEVFRYIKPFMIYGTLLNSLHPLHYKVTNKGIQKLNNDSSQTGEKNDIETLRFSYSNKVDAYKKRLYDFLSVDDVEDSITDCQTGLDSTFGFTGISLNDDTYDADAAYKSAAYKTGYYRRRYY
jgi:hypothetical protein